MRFLWPLAWFYIAQAVVSLTVEQSVIINRETELGSVNKKRLQDNFQSHEELRDVEDVLSRLKRAFQS